jgi:UDP-glucose 4-epimerase
MTIQESSRSGLLQRLVYLNYNSTMRVAITGGCGFFGSVLSQNLVNVGHVVTSIHRSEIHFRAKNHRCIPRAQIRSTQVKGLTLEVDVLVVLESVSIENSKDVPASEFMELTVQKDFLDLVNCLKPKKIIFASSGGAVYGESPYRQPLSEKFSPKPISSYGKAKLDFENFLEVVVSPKFGISTISIRISNLFGSSPAIAKSNGLIDTVITKMRRDETIDLYGADIVRDYVHIQDIVEIFELSMLNDSEESVINAGSGIGKTNLEVVSEISRYFPQNPKIRYHKENRNAPKFNVLDNSLAFSEFGWKPKIDLTQGIQKILSQSCHLS